MGMIFFRHTPLPRATKEYNEDQLAQMIRVLELYFNQLDSQTPVQAEFFKASRSSLDKFGGVFIEGVAPAIVATGSTQATATQVITGINNVTVVAAGANGVILPSIGATLGQFTVAQPGVQILVRNSDSSDALNIYPGSGAQINALGTNVAFSLAAGTTAQIFALTDTQWFTF